MGPRGPLRLFCSIWQNEGSHELQFSDRKVSNDSQPKPQTVSQLSQAIKTSLNRQFSSVWVAGEISELTKASSGHIYLTLKDSRAQINAILWRSEAERLKFDVVKGMEVECRGNVDAYPQRGTYQIIIRKIRPKGVGALELAFRQLRAKLAAEGLFDPSHKQALPPLPRHIAVVTSPTGAAVRDFLQVLTRRWKNIRVTIVPAKVQGPGAAEEIAAGIRICNRMETPLDAIVVTRGGGSVEDLWSFNEEVVVRAIHQSAIPVVSGVGHEIDITLADLVADVRALTPSEAAERLVPNYEDVVATLDSTHQRLTHLVVSQIQQAHQRLAALASRTAITQPLERLRLTAMELDFLETKLNRAIDRTMEGFNAELAGIAGRLESISPLAVLARGYSLTTLESGELMRNVESVKPGDRVTTRVANGLIRSKIDEIFPEPQ